jgi:hypothetical protein
MRLPSSTAPPKPVPLWITFRTASTVDATSLKGALPFSLALLKKRGQHGDDRLDSPLDPLQTLTVLSHSALQSGEHSGLIALGQRQGLKQIVRRSQLEFEGGKISVLGGSEPCFQPEPFLDRGQPPLKFFHA